PALVALFSAIAPAQDAAQPAKSPYESVIGTVGQSDTAAKVFTVKPDKGDDTTVKYDDKTSFLRIPAGETDMKKALPAAASDVAIGDRIVARVFTADPTGKPARTLYVTKKADLAQRQQSTEEEWKNATSGLVSSVDTGAHQIRFMAKVPGSPAPKEIVADISGKVDYRRYDPDSAKYTESTLAAVKVGDLVRVLGQKNADGTEIKVQSIGSGSFKTIGIQVKSIDAAAKSISGIEISSKRPVTVALRGDTELKKFSDAAAMMVARQLNPSYQQVGGRGGRGGGGGGGNGAPAAAPAPGAGDGAGAGAGAGGGMGRGGGRGGRNMDIGKLIEQQPSIELADLKPGDAIIVTGAIGADPARVTATALVAGVEQILRAAPSNGADPLAGSWSTGGAGGGDQ
ncbi:MAG: hypothetical protein M3N54_11485, partial [Acidobacteriota bacterium]|nr:hypothetical protein [Acidobacteriota bacterium]